MKITKRSIGRPPTEECKACFGKGYYYNDDDDWRDPDGGVSVRRCPDDECVHGKEWEETKNREEQEAEERWVRNGGRLPGQNVKENKMKITKEYLTHIIKEELDQMVTNEKFDRIFEFGKSLNEHYIIGRWLDDHQKGGPGFILRDVIRRSGERDIAMVGSVMSADELESKFGRDVKVFANYDDIPGEVRATWQDAPTT